MNRQIKNMIVSYARRLSGSWPPRTAAKDKAKVAPALHRCAKCGSLNYEGDSKKNYDKYVLQFPNDIVNNDGIEMDHIVPVVLVTGWTSWDHFFDSVFCPEENYRALCSSCHKSKSLHENSYRAAHKKAKK